MVVHERIPDLFLAAARFRGMQSEADIAAQPIANWIVPAVLLGCVIGFGIVAVLALAWAYRDGQLENLQRGAASIFDPDEPIGRVTDAYPGEQPPRPNAY